MTHERRKKHVSYNLLHMYLWYHFPWVIEIQDLGICATGKLICFKFSAFRLLLFYSIFSKVSAKTLAPWDPY